MLAFDYDETLAAHGVIEPPTGPRRPDRPLFSTYGAIGTVYSCVVAG